MPAGGNGPGDHPLPFDKTAYLRAQSLNDADRFVADGQSSGHWVFAAQDMHVGAANGCGGHADQCIQRPDLGNRLVIEHDAVFSTNIAAFMVAMMAFPPPACECKAELEPRRQGFS